MRPHEDEWFPGDCLVHSASGNVALTAIDRGTGEPLHHRVPPPSRAEVDAAQEIAKFIAAAPHTARVLLSLESAGTHHDENCCPSCGTIHR